MQNFITKRSPKNNGMIPGVSINKLSKNMSFMDDPNQKKIVWTSIF